MLVGRVQTVFAVLSFLDHLYLTQAVAQFRFNRADLAISEGGDLPSQISIQKTGQNDMNIALQVRVIPGTALNNTDYISNSEEPYVFTSSTTQLPIRTRLIGDRAGEPIENFMMCLPDAQVLQLMDAVAVDPICVTITIVDDDSVVIGFKNTFEAVVEGRSKTFCTEVKPEGLRLDPFDRVPLAIRINPASGEAQLSTSSQLVFEMSVGERCATISVAENDNVNMGNRSYDLILERNGASTVPVELYPSVIPLRVVDDDALDTSFSITSSQPMITVLEGGRTNEIQVQRQRNTFLKYNVTLIVMALTNSARSRDVVVTNSLIFDPSTTQMNVGVEIMDNTTSEKRREFNISIGRITAIEAPNADLASTVGGPVTITVYDNDFEIGFTADEFSVQKGSSNRSVCVAITKPEASSDIEPSLSIPITIMLESSESSGLALDTSNVLLNAVNKTKCLTLRHLSANISRVGSYFIQLMWAEDQAGYTVSFPRHRQNATINVTADSQDITEKSLTSGAIAGIVIGILFGGVVIISVIAIFIIVRVLYFETSNTQKRGYPIYEIPDPGQDEKQGGIEEQPRQTGENKMSTISGDHSSGQLQFHTSASSHSMNTDSQTEPHALIIEDDRVSTRATEESSERKTGNLIEEKKFTDDTSVDPASNNNKKTSNGNIDPDADP